MKHINQSLLGLIIRNATTPQRVETLRQAGLITDSLARDVLKKLGGGHAV